MSKLEQLIVKRDRWLREGKQDDAQESRCQVAGQAAQGDPSAKLAEKEYHGGLAG